MASILRSKAFKNVAKGNTSAYYSYVEERNGTNPVIQQLEKELNDYMGFVKKKSSGGLKPGEHSPSKVADALFDIWNKFESRITQRLYFQKLMQIGEFLVQHGEYTTAMWQCYDRYLNSFSEFKIESIQNKDDLRHKYFSNGLEEQNADVTFRALMGHLSCVFYLNIIQDPKLQNAESSKNISEALKLFAFIIELLLEVEHYCWLIYNATIYIYKISLYMMQYGQSKIVLEYLLFCCLSMENSIPLLGVKYLTWRSTLYAVTCECFYDCRYNDEGEQFARRALSKINELHELELASINGQSGIEEAPFREATLKIGTVLFKRLVFESRRKTKGVLRPKIRLNYKDLGNQTWPRTAVEKLLNEMFDCPSAQFLAIEVALNDSNRRIAMPMPAANENEFEMLDVVLELFFAAEYIVNGGSSKSAPKSEEYSDLKCLSLDDQTQIALAMKGKSEVVLKNFLKIVKLAFSYEAWDIFRRLSIKTLNYFQNYPELAKIYINDLLIIQLLQSTDKYYIHLRKLKQLRNEAIKAHIAAAREKAEKKGTNVQFTEETGHNNDTRNLNSSMSKVKMSKISSFRENEQVEKDNKALDKIKESDEHENLNSPSQSEVIKEEDLLANIALKLVQIMDTNLPPDQFDSDVVVDTTLLLWKKCKDVLQKFQTGAQDNFKWINKLENFSKWLFILNVIHNSMCYFNIATIDPAVFAHCSIRLGLIYESVVTVLSKKSSKDSASQTETDDQVSLARTTLTKFTFFETDEAYSERFGASNDIHENLVKAKNVYRKALDLISQARSSMIADNQSICDLDYSIEALKSSYEISTQESTNLKKIEKLRLIKEKEFNANTENNSIGYLVADLHTELIMMYHKICVRLADYKDPKSKSNLKENVKDLDALLNDCKKNDLSQSMLLLARALNLSNSNFADKKEIAQLIDKAYKKLLKVEEEDKRLYENHVNVDNKLCEKRKVPPAPVVCSKSHNKMIVQPRNFETLDGIKPSWYRLFACQITGVNFKARISDYTFPGCGEQVPANSLEKVTISNLNSEEKYVFAVAAYDKNGNLIGDSIGDSTEPILASSNISILMTYGYLCQVSYQAGDFNMAQTAYDVLWRHFVIKPLEPYRETNIHKNEVNYQVEFHQLNYDIVQRTSPVLLRKFLESIFIITDIHVKQKQIYCDVLFDGKVQYFKQIDRIKECEKLLIAMDLASWLNDGQIILQAIVQIYGLLAPLIYYNLEYEPIVKLISHCLLILEELPTTLFQRKAKNLYDNIQHMIACSTFYLTDVLKRMNKRQLANYFNLIGRKLLGIDENSNQEEQNEDNEDDKLNKNKNKKNTKASESSSSKLNELKALENYIAKTNASSKGAYFSMLSGNEETPQIYAFIAQNVTKYVFKELNKFRRRNNYFEYLVNLMQKAITEDLNQEVNDWTFDTIDWVEKRNQSILGAQTMITRKGDGVIAVGGNVQKSVASALISETEKANNPLEAKKKKKPKVKKYRLLIPLDLDISEKLKLEERQKKAIDTLYDLLPERYDRWTRRKKLRKIFVDEAAYKSQFFSLCALNSFAMIVNKINASAPPNRMAFLQTINSSSYLDPQMFLFDKNNALIVQYDEKLVEMANSSLKTKRSEVKQTSRLKHNGSRSPVKTVTTNNSDSVLDEKLYELKDTCDIIGDFISGLETFENKKANNNLNDLYVDQAKGAQNPISSSDFIQFVTNIFNRFKQAVVIAHRYKQWAQLQNACRLMFNCINTLLNLLPAISYNNKKAFKLANVWQTLAPSIFIVADCLLDMLFYAYPIDKSNKEMQNRINKWYDSANVGRCGGNLKFDSPQDDFSSIDLRFVKEFIFRSIHCLCANEKWEKCASVAMRFNAMTSYEFAEQLSPVVILAQKKLIKQVSLLNPNKKQAHFERFKAELGRYPRIEDLFFANLKVQLDPDYVNKIDLGVKIDPRVHDVYSNGSRAKELISVPLDVDESLKNLNESLKNSLYVSRALIHARRLLSLFLLSKSPQSEFFDVTTDENSRVKEENEYNYIEPLKVDFKNEDEAQEPKRIVDIFGPNPIDFANKSIENDSDVFIRDVQVNLDTVIESYKKSIQLLVAHHQKDLAVQAMHELGNVYHYSKNINLAYNYWNEALNTLIGVKESLVNWRKEFVSSEDKQIDTHKLLEKCGIWGCLLGGVLTSKMAQYFLTNDLELRTECCLFSAALFKSIFSASASFSKYDIDYIKNNPDYMNLDYLIPGVLFNSDSYRFDVRQVVAALSYVTLELVNAGHFLPAMPSIQLYEYFSRTLARDLIQTVLARFVKIEALIRFNQFSEAIFLFNSIQKGERLPHFIDEKFMNLNTTNMTKYNEYAWNSTKPIFDLNNLKCIEGLLSCKLPQHLIKLYGPHLTCRFYMIQCKLFIQIASCLPCLPNYEFFNKSKLNEFHKSYYINPNDILNAAKYTASMPVNTKKPNIEDNPDVIRVFSKCNVALSLEIVKGCLLGTAKVLLVKCLGLFNEDFPIVDKYCVSPNWQSEFKFECNILLALISDQSQLGYLALQHIVDALKELSEKETTSEEKEKKSAMKKNKPTASKLSKLNKKGYYQLFDTISKTHLSPRLWVNARILFVQFMFNQLNDADKAKGNDENIVKDFGDLKYYCVRGIEEAEKFYDIESKAFYQFITLCLELIRGVGIEECLKNLDECLANYSVCNQLSYDGFITYIKAVLLKIDLSFALNLLNIRESPSNQKELNIERLIQKSLDDLLAIQSKLLSNFKLNGGETVELYTNKEYSYFDNFADTIKNLFNPLLHYFVHVKSRLGSCLMLKASYLKREENDEENGYSMIWQHALSVLASGLELNKVIAERSVNLEIELNYKYAHCVGELFMNKQLTTLSDVVEAYCHTINLVYNSNHNLNMMRNCYVELAIAFISTFDSNILSNTNILPTPPDQLLTTTSNTVPKLRAKKTASHISKATEAALVALSYSIKLAYAQKDKMLLPGHQVIRSMDKVNAENSPTFVANDLLAYYVLAEKKKVYRDEIEEEVLSLAPEFGEQDTIKTFDQKVQMIKEESNKSITWIHVLNYQTKMQHLNAMRNLNTLKNGKNRFKFSEFYTIGFTPVFKNAHTNAARLFELNNYLKKHLKVYKRECQAPEPANEFFKLIAQKIPNQSTKTTKSLLENLKVFQNNLANVLTNQSLAQKENNNNNDDEKVLINDWTYLQEWPLNFNVNEEASQAMKINEAASSEQLVEHILTFNCYKNLVVSDSITSDNVTAVIAIKDQLTNNKIKFKSLSAEKIHEIHEKLTPLAAIADTALNKNKNKGDSQVNAEFINSLASCLNLIYKLFDKNEEIKEMKIPFELKASNILDLERMFDLNFGGHTNNDSLRNFIHNLFN